ncbi:MAG: hypothetical protein L0I93_05595 [Atopostipes suicloacalis]|nr:hypothetical protein [Atopostipes suicloacalis]
MGLFLTKEEAAKEILEIGDKYVEGAGRGYRREVASPKAETIIEFPVIKHLINSDVVTISAAGGGVPVVKTAQDYEGIESMVDKVYISFNEENQ